MDTINDVYISFNVHATFGLLFFMFMQNRSYEQYGKYKYIYDKRQF
jgi:hypothetical protein